MAALHVLKVFVSPEGAGGNPLGVFLDGAAVPVGDRQRIAAELNYSETVFVDDAERGKIRIHTPVAEIPFAGHPTVGTSWLLAREGHTVTELQTPAGELPVRSEDELTYVRARPEWSPDFVYIQLDSAAEVEAMSGSPDGRDVYVWAWLDEDAGRVRARGFFPRHNIAEDEATGSAALALCAQLGTAIDVLQGSGSVIHARPLDDGWAEVGGRTELVERREFPLGG